MKKRAFTAAALSAILALAASAVWAQGDRFSDVGAHDLGADIAFAVEKEWFQGYPDGRFQPDRRINDRQIATVIKRAFPDGSTRAEMSAFLRGGYERVNAAPLVGKSVSGPDRVEGHRFGYRYVHAQVWITDAHDANGINVNVESEGSGSFQVGDGPYFWSWSPGGERSHEAVWIVDPDATYTIKVTGMEAGDRVGYLFSELLPTLRYSVGEAGGSEETAARLVAAPGG